MENTHTHQISADNHTTQDGYKEELIILQDNLDDQVQKNTNICVRREIEPVVSTAIVSTQINFILLMQV